MRSPPIRARAENTGPASATREAGTRWGVVLASIAAGIVAGMQYGKAPPALPALRAELGLGLVAAGWVASLFNATAAAGGIAGGSVVDLWGRRRTLLAGLAALALGSLLGSFAQGAATLLLARLVEGVGFVTVVVAAPSLVAVAAAPRHQRLALGMWATFMPTGMALVIALSPLLMETAGWRGLWRASAGLTVLVLGGVALATRGVAPRPRWPGALTREGLVRTLRRPGPWLLAACFATYTMQWVALVAWLPTFLIEEQGRTVAQAALITALVVAVNVPGNLLGGWLLHQGVPRWQTIAVASVTMGLSALGILAAGVPDAIKLGLSLVFSLVGGMLPASVFAAAPVHAPAPGLVGVTNGVIVHGSNTGSLAGPPALAAIVALTGGWSQSSWLLLAMGVLGAVLALVLRGVERRL